MRADSEPTASKLAARALLVEGNRMRIPPLEGHRIWASCYSALPNPLLALESRVLPELIGPVADLRIADVACGTGRWAAHFQTHGADVTGIDFCPEMLAQAPAMLRGKLALGDAAWLPLASGAADLSICSFALGYFGNPERGIAEMARITKSGGRVIISDLHLEAIRAGWTRSFRFGGVLYEIEHFAYTLERLHGAAQQERLALESEWHAHFNEAERPIFEAARKPFADFTPVPALWIASWRKS